MVKVIEVVKVIDILVPWDWADTAKAFGAGAVAKVGESAAEAGISAATSLLKVVTDWLKDESRKVNEGPEEEQSLSVTCVIYILNPEKGKIARIELKAAASEPKLTRIDPLTESHNQGGHEGGNSG